MRDFEIHGRVFRKSSFSPVKFAGNPICVAVSITDADVQVLNTKSPDLVLTFTHDEWRAFLAGVRNAEFNL